MRGQSPNKRLWVFLLPPITGKALNLCNGETPLVLLLVTEIVDCLVLDQLHQLAGLDLAFAKLLFVFCCYPVQLGNNVAQNPGFL